MAAICQYCTFRVDGLLFAIEVARVQEVLRRATITRVPLAPPIVSGLMNLRGDVVTAIEMRARLGLPARAPGASVASVILRGASGAVGLTVDQIGDVIEAQDHDVLGVPRTLAAAIRDTCSGVIRSESDLLLLIDTKRAVSVDVAQMAAQT
jgi:purine-binding chemotaxis protein CheW